MVIQTQQDQPLDLIQKIKQDLNITKVPKDREADDAPKQL